jgi:hypothetical protein
VPHGLRMPPAWTGWENSRDSDCGEPRVKADHLCPYQKQYCRLGLRQAVVEQASLLRPGYKLGRGSVLSWDMLLSVFLSCLLFRPAPVVYQLGLACR